MIEMIIAMLFQVNGNIFIQNLSANALPWNTTISSNLTLSPTIITQNIPWFWACITLVLLLMTDYIMGIKKGVDLKSNFVVCAIVYTMLSYMEVLGRLTSSNYFFIFEFIMLIALTIMSLFKTTTP